MFNGQRKNRESEQGCQGQETEKMQYLILWSPSCNIISIGEIRAEAVTNVQE